MCKLICINAVLHGKLAVLMTDSHYENKHKQKMAFQLDYNIYSINKVLVFHLIIQLLIS